MEQIQIRPMLAKTYDPRKFKPGMYVQRKLNGIRALYQDGNFVSRDSKVWSRHCLEHIRQTLLQIVPPEIILDGELYCHGMSLQQINSRVAVMRTAPHPKEHEIEYHIFDCVDLAPFYDRFVLWAKNNHAAFSQVTSCKLVQTYQVQDPSQTDKLYVQVRKDKYEGLMYRDQHAPYSLPHMCTNKENRSPHLLKRKASFDLDAIIVGFESGKVTGKYSDTLGGFVVRYGEVEFTTGSGLSDLQRDKYWANREKLLGCKVKVEYEELSDLQKPLRNRIVLVEEPPDL